MATENTLKENEVNISTLDNTAGDNDIVEVVVEDDTPPEDQNRKQIKADPEPTDAELEKYSADVQKRMRELTFAKHSARREKEAADRERDEAVRVAKGLLEEKRNLQARFSQGEQVFIQQAQEKATLSVDQAKRLYKDAYEAGDGDKMADAQEALARATIEKERASQWQPTKIQLDEEKTLQTINNPVYNQPQQASPDPEALEWAEKNPWFGPDEEMTALAYGVHDRLMREKVTPITDPDKYYSTIEKRVREKFPEYDWPDAKREKDKSGTVVASVNRAPKSNRVTLTKSQVSLATRLGLTPELYAKELAKLETR